MLEEDPQTERYECQCTMHTFEMWILDCRSWSVQLVGDWCFQGAQSTQWIKGQLEAQPMSKDVIEA